MDESGVVMAFAVLQIAAIVSECPLLAEGRHDRNEDQKLGKYTYCK